MNRIIKSIFLLGIISFVSACEKDEGKLPNISFKTTAGYVSTDATKAGGSVVTIGIDASKAEDKDYLKKFNISKSVNGGAETSVFDKDLSGAEGDTYTYDYRATMDTAHGQTNKYTFTVTNRDGLLNKVALTLTVQ